MVSHSSHSNRNRSWFTRFAKSTARAAGQPATFCVAVAIIAIWAVSGPFFGFSDTWQLIINTGTTIVTCLMVFLIQNTQNSDSEAIQVKLDEGELRRTLRRYEQLAAAARRRLAKGRRDTGSPEIKPAC